MGKFDDIEQAYVSFAAFHSADIVSMQVGQLREFFLRKLPLQPELSDSISK